MENERKEETEISYTSWDLECRIIQGRGDAEVQTADLGGGGGGRK